MRRSAFHLLLALPLLGSCATTTADGASKTGTAGAGKGQGGRLDPSWRPGTMRPEREGDGGDTMTVENAKGTLEQRDVDAVLAGHAPALVACYAEAGAAQSFAAGQVGLRFFVTSAGDVSNVLVLQSLVGNFAVERCLVEQGRRIRFPRPLGGKATDFEYSLQFRAGKRAPLVDWRPEALAREASQHASSLSRCGTLGPEPVRAVVYIQPGGAVASVGLASPGPMDPEASTCAVAQIRKWRLPGDRRNIVRASFEIAAQTESAASRAPIRLVRRVSRRAR